MSRKRGGGKEVGGKEVGRKGRERTGKRSEGQGSGIWPLQGDFATSSPGARNTPRC